MNNDEYSNHEDFIGEVYNHMGNFCIGTGKLLLKAPKNPQLAEKLLELSINVSTNVSQTVVGSFSNSGDQTTRPNAEENVMIDLSKTKMPQLEEDQNPEYIVEFSNFFIEGVKSQEEALQILNFEASKYGYRFKKGKSDKSRGYMSLYCKYKPLDKTELTPGKMTCQAYYRFKNSSSNQWNLAQNKVVAHSHKGTDFQDITDAMKNDLVFMPRWKSISEIVTYLEAKYGVNKLSHQKVYSQFRKIKPLFGSEDCSISFHIL